MPGEFNLQTTMRAPLFLRILLLCPGIVACDVATNSQADEVAAVFPGDSWTAASPADAGLDAGGLEAAQRHALTGGGSGIVVRGGRAVARWGDQDALYDLKSTSKSIGVTALGLALGDGRMRLEDRAVDHHPGFAAQPAGNRASGWHEKVTIFQLATQTAGLEKPGGYGTFLFAPGTAWHYSDGGPNWLAECVTLVYRRDASALLFERVFSPIGIRPDDLVWRDNSYRPKEIEGIPRREFGSGVSANVDAMARIGYLYLREGRWKDAQLLPADFVHRAARTPEQVAALPTRDAAHGVASRHYGLLWWNNNDGTLQDVPRDAYWSWGLFDSLILVIPSLDLVAARAGKGWERSEDAGHYDVLAPFFEPLVRSAQPPATTSGGIKRIEWAPKTDILRMAQGSDNWPTAWGDDGALYTAFGDGTGFVPGTPEKLSLGLARVTGEPPEVLGENLRASGLEALGDGARGRKASGMLSIDGTLFLLARNTGNAQLAWSEDHGATWKWADWKFDTSFGCPTFVQFGRDNHGARDHYVYIVSPDAASAYEPADRMVMARVPVDSLLDRGTYRFLAGLDAEGNPLWTEKVEELSAVFDDPGRCHRSGVSFNAGLRCYLWVHTHAVDSRFKGGFTVRTAPEPWGTWTVAFTTEEWDVGPGETASFPGKWIARDGRSAWLLFSGDDCFSLRRAEFR